MRFLSGFCFLVSVTSAIAACSSTPAADTAGTDAAGNGGAGGHVGKVVGLGGSGGNVLFTGGAGGGAGLAGESSGGASGAAGHPSTSGGHAVAGAAAGGGATGNDAGAAGTNAHAGAPPATGGGATVALCDEASDCGADEFCDKTSDDCTGQGLCTARPQACPDTGTPVCGCDGVAYSSACAAYQAGFDVNPGSDCGVRDDQTFACGPTERCALQSEYCVRRPADVPTYPDTYACYPVPGKCNASADCDCLGKALCGQDEDPTNDCVMTDDGGLENWCGGGGAR